MIVGVHLAKKVLYQKPLQSLEFIPYKSDSDVIRSKGILNGT